MVVYRGDFTGRISRGDERLCIGLRPSKQVVASIGGICHLQDLFQHLIRLQAIRSKGIWTRRPRTQDAQLTCSVRETLNLRDRRKTRLRNSERTIRIFRELLKLLLFGLQRQDTPHRGGIIAGVGNPLPGRRLILELRLSRCQPLKLRNECLRKCIVWNPHNLTR